MSDDYYKILGINKNSDENTIKKAYKKMSLKWHPDRNKSQEATSKFQEISEAYAVISDPKKRDIYDKYGKSGLENEGMNVNPEDIFKNFFSGGFPMGGMGGAMGGIPFDIFGGGFPGQTGDTKRKGPNKKFEINLTIDDMMNGNTKKISITRKASCDYCNGSGLRSGCTENICNECNGKGMIFIQRQMGPMITRQSMPCQHCQGKGKIINLNDRCLKCNGEKIISKKIEHKLNIPPGIKHGDYEILSNMGDESENYREPGDIVFIFKEDKNEDSYRDGDNLVINLPILLSEALLGFSIPYMHPNKNTIIIESDTIITPGSKHKLEGLGFKNSNNNGDLIINFNIVFPKSLDEKRKELIGKLLPKRKVVDLNGLKNYKLQPHLENLTAKKAQEQMPNINNIHNNLNEEQVHECATQ